MRGGRRTARWRKFSRDCEKTSPLKRRATIRANIASDTEAYGTRTRKDEIDKLEKELADLQRLTRPDIPSAELDRLRGEVSQLRHDFYEHMGAWQRTLLARHPQRPYTLDYVRLLFEDFHELHGDRAFGDDPAMVGGFARFNGRPVLLVGQQKGRDTKQRVARNFGQAKPEGYRKALRVMQLAAKFGRPIFTFMDTPGAYPGIDAEERGQAEAIARNLREMARLPVPIIVTITGEGGSGGALAIAVGDQVKMLENSVYSVISPEGCASILWRDAAKAEVAAEALKITAPDLQGIRNHRRNCSRAGGRRAFGPRSSRFAAGTRTGPLAARSFALPDPRTAGSPLRKISPHGAVFRDR